jgi:type VI secretion system protein ImpH
MGSKGGGTNSSVIDRLGHESFRFDFFQAVRLLEHAARQQRTTDMQNSRQPVGWDGPPDREVVRFRAVPSLRFPPGSIGQFEPAKSDGRHPEEESPPPEMAVAFLGLTGPSGVLPRHYTTMLLRRIQLKDFALRDYFDVFNHRLISLFYRAWTKYRFPINYERQADSRTEQGEDLFTHCLFCLTGLGTDHLRGRMKLDHEAFLYFIGHFSHYPRNASALESMLTDYVGLPVKIEQLQGQWLYLSPEDCSRLPSAERPEGQNNVLGFTLVAGDRVWDVQSKFRIRIGPLVYRDFYRLMPTGTALRHIFELTRTYVGSEYDFDVQPILRRDEVPWFRLAEDEAECPRLGWNTWLRSVALDRDPEDALFSLDYL